MQLQIGKSASPSERGAAAEAVRHARDGGRVPAFAVVFATPQYDPAALAAALAAELRGIPWAGCFSAGVIAHRELLEQGLVVGVVSGEGVRVGLGGAGPLSEHAEAAGRLAAARALEGLPALSNEFNRALVVLPNAGTSRAVEAVRGAAAEGGTGVYWGGGGTGANYGVARAAQFCNGEAYEDHVVVLAIDTPGRVGAGVRHGWRPHGPPTMVTRTEGAVVRELDFMPAFDVYRATAAAQGEDVGLEGFVPYATMHPLGIPQAFGGDLIRDPLAVDAAGGLRCVAEVPDGSIVRMMAGSEEGLIEAAGEAAREAAAAVGGAPGAILLFDCFSRYIALGKSLRRELAVIGEAVGAEVPLLGCLTFGEVATFDGSVPQFHNKTAVVLGFS